MCLGLGLNRAFPLDIDLFQISLKGGNRSNEDEDEDEEEASNQNGYEEDSEQGSGDGCLQVHD